MSSYSKLNSTLLKTPTDPQRGPSEANKVKFSTPRAPGINTSVTVGDVQYKISALLGSGAYGSVYKARAIGQTTDVALKFIQPSGDVDETRSTRSEISVYKTTVQACADGMPSRIPCLRARQDYSDGGTVLVTDLAKGVNGGQMSFSAMNTTKFIEFISQIVEQIDSFHQSGITHGDIKPENMMVEMDEENTRAVSVQFIDFGLSCNISSLQSDDRDTCHFEFPQVPDYMDPGYQKGVSNLFQADMYSVGTLIESCRSNYKREKKTLEAHVDSYLSSLVFDLTLRKPSDRPTARRTKAALERLALSVHSIIHVDQIACRVVEPVKISFDCCVLHVVGLDNLEPYICKMFYTGRSRYCRAAERELFIMSSVPRENCPSLASSCRSAERADMCLLLRGMGEGGRLETFIQSAPLTLSSMVHVWIAMAEALGTLHAEPHRAAMLQVTGAAFNLAVEGEPTRLICTDFTNASSIQMQRDRPELCPEARVGNVRTVALNIFQQDVSSLAEFISKQCKLMPETIKIRDRASLKDFLESMRSGRKTMAETITYLLTLSETLSTSFVNRQNPPTTSGVVRGSRAAFQKLRYMRRNSSQ